jgi:hypothetical protein
VKTLVKYTARAIEDDMRLDPWPKARSVPTGDCVKTIPLYGVIYYENH